MLAIFQLLLSGIGYVPTLNVHSDVWDRVESYRIYLFLACRLKITFTFSLKLIISFLVQLQHLPLPYLIVTSSQVRVDMPLPLQSCCISGLGPEGLWQRGTLGAYFQKMETVLTRLCDSGIKVNAAKSLFCAHEIEYLGYILTREGIKPQPKKVQAILALSLSNNVRELRHFVGMVQYYWDMWARRSEMLAPLTDLVGECRETKTTRMNMTKKKPWQWDPIHQQVFDNVKAAIAKETVLAYPNLLKPFENYMDASSMQ